MFRKAKKNEMEWIINVLIEGELYWDETRPYEDDFRNIFTSDGQWINDNQFFIVSKDNKDIGFFGMKNSYLSFMYLTTDNIGKGLGRYLWNQVIQYCKETGITSFKFESSNCLIDYYEHMGAQITHMIKSSFGTNRMIPEFEYKLK